MLYELGVLLFIPLSIYSWFGIKKVYEKWKILPPSVAGAIWIGDTIHFVLMLLASLIGEEYRKYKESTPRYLECTKRVLFSPVVLDAFELPFGFYGIKTLIYDHNITVYYWNIWVILCVMIPDASRQKMLLQNGFNFVILLKPSGSRPDG